VDPLAEEDALTNQTPQETLGQAAPTEEEIQAGGTDVSGPAFTSLALSSPGGEASGIDLLLDITVEISVELGRTPMTIGEIMALRSSSVIELDKLAGEPADILANGTRIARGEVVVVDEKFGVRVLDVDTGAKPLGSLAK
jgi:flagellar motor switch protein FliN/FliY